MQMRTHRLSSIDWSVSMKKVYVQNNYGYLVSIQVYCMKYVLYEKIIVREQ